MQLDRPDSHETIIQKSSACIERTKELIRQSRAMDMIFRDNMSKTLELLSRARDAADERGGMNMCQPFSEGVLEYLRQIDRNARWSRRDPSADA
ncbi:MAG: hypothetical protein JO108_15345 [Acidobacteriaceae bacterium]|nr:hypothetical protein [Acidobacteriaceae bacterium]